jgi:hypothetical protein
MTDHLFELGLERNRRAIRKANNASGRRFPIRRRTSLFRR